jgi:uncharacterized protein YukE
MPNVSVDYAEVENVAKQLQSGVNTINPQLQSLKNTVDGLLGSGLVLTQTSPAMQLAYEKFTASLSAAVDNINTFSQQFTNISNQLQTMDTQMAQSVKG